MAFLQSNSRFISKLNLRWVELGGGEEEVLEKAAVAVDKVRELWILHLEPDGETHFNILHL